MVQWMRVYRDAYREATGAEHVPGSLNVKLDHEYRFPRDHIHLGAEQAEVDASLVACFIEGQPALLFRADRTEAGLGAIPRHIVEVLADVHLRDKLDLQDGGKVEIVLPRTAARSPWPLPIHRLALVGTDRPRTSTRDEWLAVSPLDGRRKGRIERGGHSMAGVPRRRRYARWPGGQPGRNRPCACSPVSGAAEGFGG